jgi:hypothetical protein
MTAGGGIIYIAGEGKAEMFGGTGPKTSRLEPVIDLCSVRDEDRPLDPEPDHAITLRRRPAHRDEHDERRYPDHGDVSRNLTPHN